MVSSVVEITVLGDVTAEALSALADAGVDRSVRTTVLEATIRDQSALYGLLEQLRDLGVELSEVRVPSAAPADVEIVVRGPVGTLLISMLAGVRRSRDAHAIHVRADTHTDLVTIIAELAGAIVPPEVGAPARHPRPEGET